MSIPNIFCLKVIRFGFQRIEVLNTELQPNALCFIKVKRKVRCLKDLLQEISQNGFDNFWESFVQNALELHCFAEIKKNSQTVR